MGRTSIPYLDRRWEPVVGCTPVDDGCQNCWANRLHSQRHYAYLFGSKLPEQYAEPFDRVVMRPDRLSEPRRWRQPYIAGVCFGSDLFHPAVVEEFRFEVLRTMAEVCGSTYVVLTKRVSAMRDTIRLWRYGPQRNIYLGVSVTDQESAVERLPVLELCAADGWKTWVAYEPALGPVDWAPWLEDKERAPQCIILGCESGKGRRLAPCAACGGEKCSECNHTGYAIWSWARQTRDACKEAGVWFHLTQLPDERGSVNVHPKLDGRWHSILVWW